jgi:hypothetical protein
VKPITPESRVQTFVIYGPSGGGKTSLSATAPKPAFLDTNKGLLSIAGRPGLEHVQGEDINDVDDLEHAFENFRGTGKRNWKGKFGTVVVDHFDDLQALVMEHLGERRHARNEAKDIDESEQKDWGVMATKLKRILRKYKTLPMHKILICGEKQDNETGRLKPSLQGQMSGQLPYFADHTMYLRMDRKGRRWLHLDSTEEFYAKTRAWWLPEEARKIRVNLNDVTTLTTLFALIAAGPKGATRKAARTENAHNG